MLADWFCCVVLMYVWIRRRRGEDGAEGKARFVGGMWIIVFGRCVCA